MKVKFKLARISKTEPKEGQKSLDAEKSIFHVSEASASDLEDKVILYSKNYEQLFGSTLRTASFGDKLLSVVKVSVGDKSIYRQFCAMNGMTQNFVALTSRSIRLLSEIKDNDGADSFSLNAGDDIEVTAPSGKIQSFAFRYLFYWHHPVHATRISTRLGIVSVALGVIAIILSVLFWRFPYC